MSVSNSWNISDKVWELVYADFFGPIRNKMYLLAIDVYSKFIEVMLMQNNNTSSAITK